MPETGASLQICMAIDSFDVLMLRWAKAKGISTAELPALNVLAAAGTGGLLYWSSIYPIDVIKSAMQTDSINPAERQYANSMAAAKARPSCSTLMQLPNQVLLPAY